MVMYLLQSLGPFSASIYPWKLLRCKIQMCLKNYEWCMNDEVFHQNPWKLNLIEYLLFSLSQKTSLWSKGRILLFVNWRSHSVISSFGVPTLSVNRPHPLLLQSPISCVSPKTLNKSHRRLRVRIMNKWEWWDSDAMCCSWLPKLPYKNAIT